MKPPAALRTGVALSLLVAVACGQDAPTAPAPAPPSAPQSAEPASELAFRPLFNGLNLAGWVVVNGAPSTWKVKDEQIVCSGKPTGVLRTDRMYENFVLELEWQHLQPGGNAGLFVWSNPLPALGVPFTRALEVQVLDGTETDDYTSHGDIFSIWGARFVPDRPHPNGWERCLPSEKRARPSPEWNQYRVTCRDGVIKLEVNGAEVSGGSGATPRKGYLCLESEGSEVRFRNLRIAELPAAEPPLPPEQVAQLATGMKTLYDGVSLRGWRAAEARGDIEGHWVPRDWTLWSDGTGCALLSEWVAVDYELQFDWRWSGTPANPRVPARLRLAWPEDDGAYTEPTGWNRAHFVLRGSRLTLDINGRSVLKDVEVRLGASAGGVELVAPGVPTEFANVFVREL